MGQGQDHPHPRVLHPHLDRQGAASRPAQADHPPEVPASGQPQAVERYNQQENGQRGLADQGYVLRHHHRTDYHYRGHGDQRKELDKALDAPAQQLPEKHTPDQREDHAVKDGKHHVRIRYIDLTSQQQ